MSEQNALNRYHKDKQQGKVHRIHFVFIISKHLHDSGKKEILSWKADKTVSKQAKLYIDKWEKNIIVNNMPRYNAYNTNIQ